MKPNAEYIAAREALMPEAEKLAKNDVLESSSWLSSDDAQLQFSRQFHLWMDRLCAERIYGKEWPR